jgi:AraC family transcriptional regulator, positive regulator of tynA and feaB
MSVDAMRTNIQESAEPASGSFPGGSILNLEEWRAAFVSLCFQCDVESTRPDDFSGWLRLTSVFGLPTADASFHYGELNRTARHVRADGIDHYAAIIAVSGRTVLIQNDEPVTLTAGDVALIDKARPATFKLNEDKSAEWLAVQLPRHKLLSHFGLEPKAGARAGSGELVSRALVQVVKEAQWTQYAESSQSDHYMQLAVLDMLAALFAKPEIPAVGAHTHKLFLRVCNIIKDSFADPDFGPPQAAAEAKISLRYLQLLFTVRGSTCTRYLQSLRLERALRLIRTRNEMKSRQPLSTIAYSCGFRDYNYFSKVFRQHFGVSPGEVGNGQS